MTNIFYPDDYKFGTKEEEDNLDALRSYFKRDIKRSESEYAKHDYYDDEYNYEMKSRTHFFGRYDETMITADKIVLNKKLILIFNFIDGLYYIEYNENKFNQYKKQLFSREDIEWNEKDHIYIPIKDLKLIKPKCLLMNLNKV